MLVLLTVLLAQQQQPHLTPTQLGLQLQANHMLHAQHAQQDMPLLMQLVLEQLHQQLLLKLHSKVLLCPL